jgi:hypothetical protein
MSLPRAARRVRTAVQAPAHAVNPGRRGVGKRSTEMHSAVRHSVWAGLAPAKTARPISILWHAAPQHHRPETGAQQARLTSGHRWQEDPCRLALNVSRGFW